MPWGRDDPHGVIPVLLECASSSPYLIPGTMTWGEYDGLRRVPRLASLRTGCEWLLWHVTGVPHWEVDYRALYERLRHVPVLRDGLVGVVRDPAAGDDLVLPIAASLSNGAMSWEGPHAEAARAAIEDRVRRLAETGNDACALLAIVAQWDEAFVLRLAAAVPAACRGDTSCSCAQVARDDGAP